MLICVNGEKSSTVVNNLVEIVKENSLIPRRYLNYLLEELPKIEEEGKYELE